MSLAGQEFGDSLSVRVGELVETLKAVSQPLANVRNDAADGIDTRVTELTESLKTLTESRTNGNRELTANISARITEITDLIDKAVPGGRKRPERAAS